MLSAGLLFTNTHPISINAIGALFSEDYTAVSQERRRLTALMERDGKTKRLVRAYEAELSSIKK
jgi:hypothetical protein